MPDIFDEFLDELKRRQAGGRPTRPRPVNGDGGPEGDPDEDPEDPQGFDDEPDDAPPPPRRPVRPRAVDDTPAAPGRRTWVLAGIAIALFMFVSFGVEFWTDVLWYRSVGFESVMWTRVWAGFGLFLGVGAATLVVLLVNLWLAGRLAPPADPTATTGLREFLDRLNDAALTGTTGRAPQARRPVGPDSLPDIAPLATGIIAILAVVGSLLIGGGAAAAYETVLLWINRVPFSAATAVTDPVFGQDVSWFLFDLPFLRAVQSIFNALVLGALIVAGGRYLAGAPRAGLVVSTPVRVHLAILGALYLLSVAFGYQLDKFELVYSSRGISTGVSFTDANAQFLAYDLMTGLSAFAGAFLVGGAFTRWTWPLGVTVVTWFLASIFVGRIYPEIIQRFTVEPNQFAQEEPYIANNIAMTRLAFGLDAWEERRYGGEAELTEEQIAEEAVTFQNARLWDYRPLGDTLDQLQTVRRYYDFVDVDTDRYLIGDDYRQVMLAARELNLALNPSATGWVNQRIIYTHGIGLTMAPVNEVTTEGQPVLLVKNLPPVSSAGVPEISEPRIYFGESPSDYVVVGARQDEFDYPRGGDEGGDVGVQTRWTGTTGIKLDTVFSRFLYALRFRDLDLLISDQVTVDSQLLMHRTLRDRLDLIAPFLAYDKDPYVVIGDDGGLVYIQDAYTMSDRFPNAQGFDPREFGTTGLGFQPFNYLRNSVKVVMDAYDGTMTFYVSDPSDPLIRAWQGVFPGLFTDIAEMPEGLRPHLRVPEELFNVQTRMFGKYHVTDEETFFRNDDQWTVPAGQTNEQSLPSEAYYVIMRMPGEAEPEFLLLQPMVPTSRPNMIAWVAARNDAPNYGGVRVYRFPADTTVFGPAQIEARIDQDPKISAQVTLWDQSGSRVIRGNLIVVPIGDALIYLQPVYLQSTSASFPEFQRIIVASPTAVVWGETLEEALKLLLEANGGPTPTPTPTPGPGPSPTPGPSPSADPSLPTDVAGLIAYANDHYERAEAALRAGDFATYGAEIELVRQALAQLEALAGPTPVP